MRTFIFATALFSIIATVAPAQALGTDLFSGHTGGRIVRSTPGGPVQQLAANFGYFLNGLTMDTDNKTLVAIDSLSGANPQRVIRIDTTNSVITSIVFGGAPFSSVQSWIEVDQDGDYMVADGSSSISSNLFKVKRDGSGISTVFSGPAGAYYFSFTEEKNSGDWLIGDFASPRRIIRVDRQGTVVSLIPLPAPPTGMMQDPERSEVIISGGSTTFLSYDPSIHTVTTIVTGAGSANVMTLDRSAGTNGALLYAGMTTGALVAFDRMGTNLGTVANTGAGSCLGLIFDQSRNLGPQLTTAPDNRIIRVNFASEAGKPYVVAFSLNGCKPGIPLGGRTIPLNPDALAILTTTSSLPPILTGNIGSLSATGNAVVTLDLNSLNLPALTRIWCAAVVLDPGAANGISQISSPLLFVL